MSSPRQTHPSAFPGGAFVITVLLLLFALIPDLSNAQELTELPSPVEQDFPDGYAIIGPDGKLVKSVTGPTKAKIQAYFERDGYRLYLSDWSYVRLKEKGIKPNLMAVKITPLPATSQPPAEQPDEPVSPAVAQSSIRGTSDEGKEWQGEWAYEFVEAPSDSVFKELLSRDNDRELLSSDGEWIVTGQFIPMNPGRGKHILSFYRSNDLQLVFRLSIPNYVMRVQWSPKRKQFFLITTRGDGKWNYVKWPDDITQALVLVDPGRRTIERTRILQSEGNDDWNFFNRLGPTGWVGDSIEINFPEGTKSPIPLPRLRSSEFSDIAVITKTIGKGIIDGTRDVPDRSGLHLLGLSQFIDDPHRAMNLESSMATLDKGPHAGTHLVRSTAGGGIFDLNLTALKGRYFQVSPQAVTNPGIFEDGTLHGMSGEELIMRSDGGAFRTSIGSLVSGENVEAGFTPNSVLVAGQRGERTGDFEFAELDSQGEKLNGGRLTLPVVDWIGDWSLMANRRSLAWIGGDFDEGSFWKEFDLLSDAQVGESIEDRTGKGIGSKGHQFGSAPGGWQITTTCCSAYTGGRDYTVDLLRKADGKSFNLGITPSIAGGSLPLVMHPGSDQGETAMVLSTGDYSVELLEVDLRADTKRSLHRWSWNPAEGTPLYSDAQKWFLVPRYSGFEVYQIFGEEPVVKIFDLLFNGEQEYAIILPSGEYAGSPGCEAFLNLTDKSGAKTSASVLAPWRNRPAAILKALGGDGQAVAALEATTSRWLARLGIDPTQPEPTAAQLATVLASTRPGLFQHERDLEFPVSVRTGDEPVKSVRVLVNGTDSGELVESGALLAAGREHPLMARLRLSAGQNWIELIATDKMGRHGASERFRVIYESADSTPRRFVATLGVSTYESINDLPFAVTDAAAAGNLLGASKRDDTKRLELLEHEVDRSCVERLRRFFSDATEDDEICLFLAGHGELDEELEFNFIPGKSDHLPVEEIGISLSALLDVVNESKSRRRLLLLDSCHSGLLGEKEEQERTGVSPVDTRGSFRPLEELFRLPGLIRGVTIIAASRGSELAWEAPKVGGGFFTATMREALGEGKGDLDKDERILVSELRDYLNERLPELSIEHETPSLQIPSVVAFEADQDFSLSR